MAQKGVNLLDDDDESRDDFEEEMEEGGRPQQKSGGGKDGGIGNLVRIAVIAIVILAVLGGGVWAGYRFWWLPKIQRQEELRKAQEREQKMREERLARLRAEAEQRKQALAILQEVEQGQKGKTSDAAKEAKETKETKEKEEIPKSSAGEKMSGDSKPAVGKTESQASAPRPGAEPMESPSKQPAATPAAAPAQPKFPQKMAAEKPPSVAREITPPPKAKKPAAAPKPSKPAAASPTKTVRAPRRSAARDLRAGGFYSVQVAMCRTSRCVTAFVSRLRNNGFEPHVATLRKGGRVNEVLLGQFLGKAEAEQLASRAKSKNLRVSVYESGGKWRVSAGRFRDLENAAQMLDRVEDAGLHGELARAPGTTASGLRTVRTGRLATRQEALKLRERVVRMGFKGSFVVRQSNGG